ncbi:MAG: RAMP superfamily CRISPR-associated protein [Smithella sp.]
MAKKNREEKIVNKPFAVLKSMDTKNLEKGTEYTPHPRKASTAQQSVTASPGSQTIDQNPAERVIIGREEYANWLNDEPVGNHNPNPFDFVFLSEKPTIFEDEVIKTLEQDQDLYSGYLDIELITLTPVHIVGTQIPDKPGRKIARSCFYKEDNDYCIPGSSIKGMLRSFVEAITNGWVSQAQELANTKPSYPKVYGTLDRINGRHIGFDSYKVTENTHGNGRTSKIEPGIPCKYRTDRKKGLDISSYLFGVISEEKGLSRKHKLVIEDAIVTESDLHDYDMVDIEDSAFMGGAHPSASNWWYMVPSQIWERTTDNHNHVVEMIGEGFWGRKFYFHQDPIKCIAFYKDNTKWIPDPRRPMPLYPYPAACLDKQKKIKFRISVKRIPKIMLDLLCLCLIPGRNIRHKLGYGKQYGYGAVELEIKKAEMRKESLPLS